MILAATYGALAITFVAAQGVWVSSLMLAIGHDVRRARFMARLAWYGLAVAALIALAVWSTDQML